MALVEVIQGDRTSTATIEKATQLMRAMGKTPARAKDTPGFIVNRIARPFYNEGVAHSRRWRCDPSKPSTGS